MISVISNEGSIRQVNSVIQTLYASYFECMIAPDLASGYGMGIVNIEQHFYLQCP